jgi:hypothetical protein
MKDVRHITVPQDDDGQRLDRWLKKNIEEVSFVMAQKLIRTGQIRIDGKRVKPDARLVAGQEIRLPPMDERPEKQDGYRLRDEDAEMIIKSVLYDDGNILAINKPSGIATQGGMNIERHMGEHFNLFLNLVKGDGDSAVNHKKFYNEYLSVMDLSAEFYLQTLQVVFKDHALPNGTWKVSGKLVDAGAITKTGIIAIEGELDDISGLGQTKAALKITKNLPESKKLYHMQKGVGHYGSFNGRRFREQILPVIREFTTKMEK